ncbi:hypothetical protein R3P38DRAFT_3196253 [Favolaschia claudopus]|uniref:Fructose-bisphosphate aldolase n=1 Tax=Favolaschia claudopus TaxID=2862362 RepID=A0AAW0B723_9AGAR
MSTSNPQLAAGEYLELCASRGLTISALSHIGYTLPSESTRYQHTHTITELDAALARPPSDADGPGHVYLMKTKDSNGGIESKVGFSNDPNRRLGEWGRQCYRSEFELVATVPTLHARKLGA